ncbi:MAG: hypothetical protein CMN76_07665 [Spirochaetaceae bacterium]|nr:hypothetical protein [Spirochaetaceae bacterium]|tara:strand:+ start:50474 stop:51484 length:1011 start_codon:yes stop_codon:yes gene_type:complete
MRNFLMPWRLLIAAFLLSFSTCTGPEAEVGPPPPSHSPGILRIMTWNVSLREFIRENRAREVIRAILVARPHIVAFQEMTPEYYRLLEKDPGFSAIYRLVPGKAAHIKGRLVIASRIPVISNRFYNLPGRMGRYAQQTEFYMELPSTQSGTGSPSENAHSGSSSDSNARGESGNPTDSQTIRFSTINLHLESYLQDGPIRARQLQSIRSRLQGPTIVLGDFNFGDGPEAITERNALPEGYRDLWKEKHGSRPGLTWNQEENPLSYWFRFEGEHSRRLDYILLYENSWQLGDVFLYGREKVLTYRGKEIPASDHYAVVADLLLTSPLKDKGQEVSER